MIDSKEVRLFLANNYGNTELIHIQYEDEQELLVGYLESMQENTLDFTLQKHTTKSGDQRLHGVDFDRIGRIDIKINDTTETKSFE